MMIVNVKTKTLIYGNARYACRIGREGYIEAARGREGDWKTPLGTYALRYGFYRADRLPKPKSALTFHALKEDDGWCDASGDIAYNLPVKLPYPVSAEVMSAIFLHVAHIDDKPTAGCVAVSPDVMAALLPVLHRGMTIEITRFP